MRLLFQKNLRPRDGPNTNILIYLSTTVRQVTPGLAPCQLPACTPDHGLCDTYVPTASVHKSQCPWSTWLDQYLHGGLILEPRFAGENHGRSPGFSDPDRLSSRSSTSVKGSGQQNVGVGQRRVPCGCPLRSQDVWCKTLKDSSPAGGMPRPSRVHRPKSLSGSSGCPGKIPVLGSLLVFCCLLEGGWFRSSIPQ
jgi:hypothetical protein